MYLPNFLSFFPLFQLINLEIMSEISSSLNTTPEVKSVESLKLTPKI